MNWDGCDLVEVIPGKVSGVPLVKGTRIPADFIWEDLQRGRAVDDLIEDYPALTREVLQKLRQFAQQARPATAA